MHAEFVVCRYFDIVVIGEDSSSTGIVFFFKSKA